MSRTMHGDEPELFRAVIRREYQEESIHKLLPVEAHDEHYGPFRTEAQARAAITRESRPKWWHGPGEQESATGHIERTALNWERVINPEENG